MNNRRVRRSGKRFIRQDKRKFKASDIGPVRRLPNWSSVHLEPFPKNFYREHPNVMNRLRQDVDRFRNKHEITVQGPALNPIESFDEVFMPDYVAREIMNQGYSKPTPIQSQTWPIAFSGHNLVGIAQTGSGKTLAYILPAIIHINNQLKLKPSDGPIAVVLAPTRELAVQILQVIRDFGSSTQIRSSCIVGGVDKKPQQADLLRGCEIIVATPGRLLDFLSEGVTNMRRCTYVVLDEADRMLDMGFEVQIRKILAEVRPDRQILMWSATWPFEIRRLAEEYLNDFIQVNIGSLELSANHNIKQFVHICQESDKSSKLQLLLRQIYKANQPGKILIFVSKKKRADMISKYINNFGVPCESLHGDKPQSARTKILDDFRSGRSNIIVATDVAARGLDVDGIMYVINLDFPKLIEDYVHRIGRCGRCDRLGISYAFFTKNDAKQANELIAILNEANQPVDPKLLDLANNSAREPPEKVDKKQRRLDETSGFTSNETSTLKRHYDNSNINYEASSNRSGDDLNEKRSRYDDSIPNPPLIGGISVERSRMDDLNEDRIRMDSRNMSRGLMDDRHMSRDLIDDRNMNRGMGLIDDINVTRGIMDDRIIDRRIGDLRDDRNIARGLMDDRNLDRGMDDRNITRGLMDDRNITRGLMDDRNITRGLMDDRNITRGLMDDRNITRGLMDDRNITRGLMDDRNITRGLMDDRNITRGLMDDRSMDSGLMDDRNLSRSLLNDRNGFGLLDDRNVVRGGVMDDLNMARGGVMDDRKMAGSVMSDRNMTQGLLGDRTMSRGLMEDRNMDRGLFDRDMMRGQMEDCNDRGVMESRNYAIDRMKDRSLDRDRMDSFRMGRASPNDYPINANIRRPTDSNDIMNRGESSRNFGNDSLFENREDNILNQNIFDREHNRIRSVSSIGNRRDYEQDVMRREIRSNFDNPSFQDDIRSRETPSPTSGFSQQLQTMGNSSMRRNDREFDRDEINSDNHWSQSRNETFARQQNYNSQCLDDDDDRYRTQNFRSNLDDRHNDFSGNRNEPSFSGRNEPSFSGRNESGFSGRNESSFSGRNETSFSGRNDFIEPRDSYDAQSDRFSRSVGDYHNNFDEGRHRNSNFSGNNSSFFDEYSSQSRIADRMGSNGRNQQNDLFRNRYN